MHPLTFPVEYAQLRAAMLPAFARVIQASRSFQTSPPPAIAASLAMTTGLEKHRCEHVFVQVQIFLLVLSVDLFFSDFSLCFRPKHHDTVCTTSCTKS